LAPLEALLFGGGLTAVGLGVLALGVGWLAALVVAATFVLYVFAYTPLKVRTPFCTLVGAVPGALPPVAGWAAARDDVAVGAWVVVLGAQQALSPSASRARRVLLASLLYLPALLALLAFDKA